MRWKMEIQYRGAMIGGVICQVFFGLILVSLYHALYDGKPQSIPMESVSTGELYRSMLRGASDSELAGKIRTGDIAYDLSRPLNLYGYYYVRILALKLMGSIMRAVPMLLFAACLPKGWGVMLPVSGLLGA